MLIKINFLKRICIIIVLGSTFCCQLFSQLDGVVLNANIEDSIRYYENDGDYLAANQFIAKRLDRSDDITTDIEFNLIVRLFSNELSLRENALAKRTSKRIDSLIITEEITNYDLEDLGLYFHKKGVLYFRFDDFKTSIEAYSQAVEYRINATTNSDLTVIKSLKNLGHAYHWDGNLRDAAKVFTQSIRSHLLREDRDKPMLQSTYSSLSNVCIEMNDLDKGLKYLQSSVSLAEELYGSQSIYMAEIYSSDVFQYYEGIHDVDEMINAGIKAESILSQLNSNDPDVQSILSNTYNNLAIAYENHGEVNKSEEYLIKSISLNVIKADRIYFLIDNYLNLTSLLINSNQFKKANLYLKDVQNILTPDLDSIAFGLYYYHQAELERHEKKYIQAEADFIRALKYFSAYEDSNLQKIKNGIPSYIQVLFDYAQLYSDQFVESNEISKLYTYDSIFAKIDLGIDAMRDDFSSQASKIFLSSDVQNIYEHAISIYFELFEKTGDLGLINRAFEIIEKNKSLAILEELENRKRLLDAELPQEFLVKIEALEQEILELNLQVQTESETKDVNEKIIQADLALDNVYTEISITHPQYESLQFNNESMQLVEAQKLAANEDVTIIQYFLADEFLYLMYIDENEVEFNRVQVDSMLTVHISALRGLINDSVDKVNFNYKEREDLFTDFLLTSKQLYQSLILPVESHLSVAQNLVIIPDKHIGFIPFDVLSSTGSEADYLIHKYNISYAYSMGLYEWMVNTSHESELEKICGFAPSFTDSAELSPLPFNKIEIQQISDVLALDSRIDDQATKEKFLELYEEYSVIHLSTHGIVDHTNPSHSYIAFNEGSDSLDLANNLHASEIFNLNSKAELLVLSACETAIGEIAEGEGIMSLSRAWAATGVKSIVSTLWRIDDQFTSDFMTQFYREISKGESKSNALWNAKKIALTSDVYNHPYYWASFTLMGDRGPISFAKQINYLTMGFLVLGAMFMLLLFYFVCKRVL